MTQHRICLCPACGNRIPWTAADQSIRCVRCSTVIDVENIPAPPQPADMRSLSVSNTELEALELPLDPTTPEETVLRHRDTTQKDKGAPQEQRLTNSLASTAPQGRVEKLAPRDEWICSPLTAAQKSSYARLIEALGPALLVCTLFLGWVIYHQATKPPLPSDTKQAQALLIQAIASLRAGDSRKAYRLVEEASQLPTDPDTTSELKGLLLRWKPARVSRRVRSR